MEMSRVRGQNCKFDCHISCQSLCPLYSLTHTQTCIHTLLQISTHNAPPTLPAIHSNLQDNQSACSVLFCFLSFPYSPPPLFFFWITSRSNVQLLKRRQLRYLTDFLLGYTPDRGWHNFWSYNLVVGSQCVSNRDHLKSRHSSYWCCKCNGNKGGVGKLLWRVPRAATSKMTFLELLTVWLK